MNKVCVFGASGFVGRALVERLLKSNYKVISAIHSPGNAWSILRFDTPIVIADLSEIDSINNALSGCDYVVNLSLGKSNEMVAQLNNLVSSCIENKVKRLIHISSITVYGDNPSHESRFESGPTQAKKGSYGWLKMKQDEIIKKANCEQLSTVSLCPPHITGAYGRIFHQVIESIKLGTFALIEGGNFPCNLVDVNNICYAIELALKVDKTDGGRIFITNGDNYTWRDLAMQASKLAGRDFDKIPDITKEDFRRIKDNISLILLFKKLLRSEDLKSDIGKTILFRNKAIYSFSRCFYSKIKKNNSKNNIIDDNSTMTPVVNVSLCKQQLRGVRHEISPCGKNAQLFTKIKFTR